MSFTFDGLNKIITPVTGTISLDSKELYSAWKDWVALSDNSKWPPAFDVLGGDELSPGVTAGSYFFLRNDLGWRLRPAEENATVYVYGNLVPRDSSQPLLVTTTGNYCVLYAGLQPITQSVASLLTDQQTSLYGGKVYVDTVYGSSGSAYPYGTASLPVNNLNDAITLTSSYGFEVIVIQHGQLYLESGASYAGLKFESDVASSALFLNQNDISGCSFYGLTVSGTVAESSGRANFNNCFIVQLDEVNGNFKECLFDGHICFTSGTHYISFGVGGKDPVFMCDNRSGVHLIIRNWSGPITFDSNIYNDNTILLDAASANITFNQNFISGDATLFGVGVVTNNSTGTFVPKTTLLQAPQVDRIEKKVDNVMAVSL